MRHISDAATADAVIEARQKPAHGRRAAGGLIRADQFDFRYGQVYRWAYDYSVPGAEQDFVAQNQPTGRTRRLGKRAVSITILLFLAPIGAIIAWWLSRQRLMSKPWLEV